MENAFAKETFKAWFDSNKASFSGLTDSKDIDAPSGRAAWVQLHTPSHTVGISAWDQGNRLEIITIDVETEEAKVEDRAYASPDKLRARLDAFLEQLAEMRD